MRSPYGGLLGRLVSICLVIYGVLLPTAAYQRVSDATLRQLPRPNEDFDIYTGAILSPILRARVPGTPGSTAVLNHFVDFFRNTLPDWKVEFQNSTSKTPVFGNKDVPFVNFIASRDPPWAAPGDVGRLTLVAHYDSKLEPEGFIGAIDSAAPCAMIMHAMRSIDAALTSKWNAMRADGQTDSSFDEHVGIQVIFLDGEEAFHTWSDTDSLYGARSLAAQWAEDMHPAMSTYKTQLSSISLFVLLDLLGSKHPIIHSYYPTTHWAYQHLAELEKRLRNLHMFKSSSGTSQSSWFIDHSKSEHQLSMLGGIEDDHLPFLRRGVEILHLIDSHPFRPGTFPEVWHTIYDDGEHLDMDTVEDWSVLISAFAAEWMELEGHMRGSAGQTRAEASWERKSEL